MARERILSLCQNSSLPLESMGKVKPTVLRPKGKGGGGEGLSQWVSKSRSWPFCKPRWPFALQTTRPPVAKTTARVVQVSGWGARGCEFEPPTVPPGQGLGSMTLRRPFETLQR